MFVYHEYKMFDLIREYKFHHDDLNRHLNLLIPIDWLNLTKNKDKKIFRLSLKQKEQCVCDTSNICVLVKVGALTKELFRLMKSYRSKTIFIV